jgi:F0F1-type ATP synthase assembly protein I
MESEDEKLKNLSYRIRGAERKTPGKTHLPSGSRIGFEFVGQVVVCGIVGALADRAFKTAPWCLIGAAVLGFAIGIYNAWQAMKQPEGK